jgi:poly(glycerol-phosphate) alpha-glucosyltransferase
LEAASRRPSFFPPERRVLFYLGRLHPKKGLIALLRAWKDVHARYPEWLLVIAGWDQEGHAVELQRAAAKLDLAWANGAVKLSPGVALCLPGPQFGPAKDDCLQNCDALVLPSQSEGLPMVILEAWSFAKPVLMTPACNLPQGADAGAAVVADPKQESLALELLQILESSPEQLKEMGRRGRALVEDRYQWPKIASQMVGVYEWVLGSRNAPGCVEVLKN